MTTTDNRMNDQRGVGDQRAVGRVVQDLLAEEATRQSVPDALLVEAPSAVVSPDLPCERYTSREFHQLEVDKMWRKVWQMACREADLPNVGDTHVYDIADDSIMLVRTESGTIKAYYNACLHRGTQLVTGKCNIPYFRCPFHSWSWNLDGSLKEIPCR